MSDLTICGIPVVLHKGAPSSEAYIVQNGKLVAKLVNLGPIKRIDRQYHGGLSDPIDMIGEPMPTEGGRAKG